MWIKLIGANFSTNNIGTLSTYSIKFKGAGITNTNTYVDKENNTGYTATITFAEGYELDGSITVTMGGTDITSTAVSGLTITISKVTGDVEINVPTKNTATEVVQWNVTINATPNTATITIYDGTTSGSVLATGIGTANAIVNDYTRIAYVVEADGYQRRQGTATIVEDTVKNIELVANGGGANDGTITWELGAINSGGGPNSEDMPTKRVRTVGYLQVENSITIKATGNVEFCPIYYKADKTYISSPNAYQTTDCVVNASQYPLVRLMIRDKTNTSKDLTSSVTELGNSIVITGNFVEIPYDGTSGGGTSGGGTSGTTGATGIGEGATWQSGAIDSTSGNGSVSMASRIHTGFIPLGSVTVSVSGDAEFCPFLYRADKTYIKPSTTPTYQKTTQTWTSTDGAYLVLMARNSVNTSATKIGRAHV